MLHSMPVRFHRSAMLDRTEAKLLAAAIREGIGDRDGVFEIQIFVPLDYYGYEIHIKLPQGRTLKLICDGPRAMLPSSIRDSVRRAR